MLNISNVGIGTPSPDAELEVVGDILATGTITPDYVFENYFTGFSEMNKDYRFMSDLKNK